MVNVFQSVSSLREYGVFALPANKTRKCPDYLGSWQNLVKPLTDAELHRICNHSDSTAICIPTGPANNNIELLDFDDSGSRFEQWREQMLRYCPGLFDRLVVERSPSGGYHCWYRLPEWPQTQTPQGQKKFGNKTLAKGVYDVDKEGEYEYNGKKYTAYQTPTGWQISFVLIETRGHNALGVCAPTDGYEVIQGSLHQIPTIEMKDRDAMFAIAESFNEKLKPVKYGTSITQSDATTDKPGDWFSQTQDPRPYLESAGWRHVGFSGHNEHWKRPGSTNPFGATYHTQLRKFYSFSTNCAPFEAETPYSPFAVYATLKHNGDFKAAARQIVRDHPAQFRKPDAVKTAPPAVNPETGEITSPDEKPSFIKFSDMFSGLYSTYAPQPRVRCGIEAIDRLLDSGEKPGGWVYGSFNVLVATTGRGKSTLAANIARSAAKSGVKTGLISLEDSPELTLAKLVAQEAGIPVKALQRHILHQIEVKRRADGHAPSDLPAALYGDWLERFQDATQIITQSQIPLYIDHSTSDIDAIEANIIKQSRENMKICIIDQSSWISAPNVKNQFELATEISNRVAKMSRANGMVILLVMQVNREGSKRKSQEAKPITVYDIKDTAKAAENAIAVLCIQDVFHFDGQPSMMRVDVLKNREGKHPLYTHLDYYPESGVICDNVDTSSKSIEPATTLSAAQPKAQPKIVKNPEMSLEEFVEEFIAIAPVEWPIIEMKAEKAGLKAAKIEKYRKQAEACGLMYRYKITNEKGVIFKFSTQKPAY